MIFVMQTTTWQTIMLSIVYNSNFSYGVDPAIPLRDLIADRFGEFTAIYKTNERMFFYIRTAQSHFYIMMRPRLFLVFMGKSILRKSFQEL